MRTRFSILIVLALLFYIAGDATHAASRPIATVPTGTGAVFVNAGAQEAAARSIVNADIDSAAAIALSKIGNVGASGEVLTSNGSAWAAAAAPSGGWKTALDCDFTAASTVALTNGDHTICGVTWTARPAASSRGQIDTINATGLRFQSYTGGTHYGPVWSGAVNSSSSVWASLTNIGVPSTVDYSTGFRVWIYVPTQTCGTGADGFSYGISNNAGANPHDFSSLTNWFSIHGIRKCTSATTPALQPQTYLGNQSTSFGGTVITGITDWGPTVSTTRVVIHSLIPYNGSWNPTEEFGPAYSGGWPTTMVPWGVSNVRDTAGGEAAASGIAWANSRVSPTAIGSFLGVFIAWADLDGASGTHTGVVARVRVDYRL